MNRSSAMQYTRKPESHNKQGEGNIISLPVLDEGRSKVLDAKCPDPS